MGLNIRPLPWLGLLLGLQLYPSAIVAQDLYPFQVEGRWGFVAQDGKVKVDPRYQRVSTYSENRAWGYLPDGLDLLNERGKVVKSFGLITVSGFQNGVSVVGTERQFGLINTEGEFLLPREYVSIEIVNANTIIARTQNLAKQFNYSVNRFVGLHLSAKPGGDFGLLARSDTAWQFYDSLGQPLFQGMYSDAYPFSENRAWARSGTQWGVIDREGNWRIQPQFSGPIGGFSFGMGIMTVDELVGAIDTNGYVILPPEYVEVKLLGKNLLAYREGQLYGLVDGSGYRLTEPTYTAVFPLQQGLALYQRNGRYGYLNAEGREVIGPRFEQAMPVEAGWLLGRLNGNWGAITATGEPRIPFAYRRLEVLGPDLLASLTDADQVGVLTGSGDTLLPFSYTQILKLNERLLTFREPIRLAEVSPATGELMPLELTDEWGVVGVGLPDDARRKLRRLNAEPEHHSWQWAADSLVWVANQRLDHQPISANTWLRLPALPLPAYLTTTKWALANLAFNSLSSYTFDEVSAFEGPYARVRINDKWGLSDRKGHLFLEPAFDFLTFTEPGYYRFRRDTSYGVVTATGSVLLEGASYVHTVGNGWYEIGRPKADLYGRRVIRSTLWHVSGTRKVPFRPDRIRPFSEGYAAVKPQHEALWGYIDTLGQYIFQPQYQDALPFREGYAPVKRGEKWGYVDPSGNFSIEPQFQQAPVRGANRWGFVNPLGRVVVGFLYEEVQAFRDGAAAVKLRGKWGLIDKTGLLVVQPQYDQILYMGDGIYRVGLRLEDTPGQRQQHLNGYRYGHGYRYGQGYRYGLVTSQGTFISSLNWTGVGRHPSGRLLGSQITGPPIFRFFSLTGEPIRVR